MAMWQIVLGSFSGIVAGSGLGILGYFLYVRRAGNKRVTLLAVLGVLCGVAGRGGREAASTRESVAGKLRYERARVPAALRAVGDPWAAVLATREAAQEAFALVANPAEPALVASGVSSVSVSMPESSGPASIDRLAHDEDALALLAEFKRDVMAAAQSDEGQAVGAGRSDAGVNSSIHGLLSELKKDLQTIQATELPAASTIRPEQPTEEKSTQKSTSTHSKKRAAKSLVQVPPAPALSASSQAPDGAKEQAIPVPQLPIDDQPRASVVGANDPGPSELMTQLERMLAVESGESKVEPTMATIHEAPVPALPTVEQSLAGVPDTDQPDMVELMGELERNLELVREASGDAMAPLGTEVWERKQRFVRGLPADTREALESVYADIGLLNRLAWMSSQFGRRSPDMVKQYLDLSRRIAASVESFTGATASGRG